MRIGNVLWLVVLLVVVSALAWPLQSNAQCYLSQGCKPVDDLTYLPIVTGQVFHGDGASTNGAGGWTTDDSDENQCLSCHYGTDTLPYLMTGHKNTLRKMAPGLLWGGPDGASYPTIDSKYGSGSVFSWSQDQVTVGWCTPLATLIQAGSAATDSTCEYPFYTLSNANAPANYTPVAPTPAAGGVRTLYYLYGGWQNYGGTANPAATQLNTIFDHGFTGDLYPKGNFDCGRCHTTGYNFDQYGPEPTQNAGNEPMFLPDADFSRIPSDGYVAPGTVGTSSWFLTGVQCERCHVAAYGYGSHPWGTVPVTVPHNEAATALCMECHRGESITPANPAANPPTVGSIAPANSLKTLDRGFCSDLSGATYANCVINSGNQWEYRPYFDHEAGQSFLNSPHARFTGTLTQNEQHSADLSITIGGTYASQFSENIADSTKNLGCTGCHDPHQSTVAAVHAKPITKTCDQCHNLAQHIMSTVNHPMGPGTPFPTGTQADIPGACVTCHMQAALGRANSHLFRISADANYSTFPPPNQIYTQNITTPETAPEYSTMNLTTFGPATWLDVDLACGQCHVGNDGVTNEYGLTLPPGMPGAHAYTKTQLAYWASVMHAPDPGVPTPTFSPAPGAYHSPQTITISDAQSGAKIYYTTDGTVPTTGSPVYTGPIPVATSQNFYAIATYPGLPASNVVLASYNIQLPTAPPPLFSPPPSTFASSQMVSLTNTANLPMYFTLDGSTPTTQSTLYSVPISVTKNTTINAITAGAGYLTSIVSSGTFLIQGPAPTFAPASGTYYTPQNVVISDSNPGAIIYYTANGMTPTTSSTACGNPCTVNVAGTTTLKAIAASASYAASNVSVGTYSIAANAPSFSPAAGTYYGPLTVTLSQATSSATIYYTTNGSFPSTSSPSCSSPCSVAVASTTTLRAMAAGAGISQSNTAVGVYTIAANLPTFSPAPGSYSTAQTVTISEASSGVTIYYSTTGLPSTSSPSCTSPCTVVISTTSTLRAMALGNGISQSNIAAGVYTITGP